jgi:hypothetical protein
MSFLRKKSGTVDYFKKGFRWELWEIFNFYAHFFPTEKGYLVSTWRWYQRVRRSKFFSTVMDFLDERVRYIRADLADPDTGRRTKLIEDGFLQVILNPHTRKGLIEFLEKPAISLEDVRQVQQLMKTAWRVREDEAEIMAVSSGPQSLVDPEPTVDPEPSVPEHNGVSSAEFPAKTYVIATQLHFELAGKEEEYAALSVHLDQLESFIKEKFAVPQLPANFQKNLKGYSYKPILNGKNTNKKGQLKPFFRQIIGHPEVFGEAVAQYAKQVFERYFED